MLFNVEGIGIVGVILYSVVFFIASYRAYFHFVPYRPPLYATRKLFHICLALYGALQALSFISFLKGHDIYEKWTYSVHLFGIFCEVCAFSLVSILWSKTLMSRNNARKCVIPFLVLVDSIFLFYIIYLVFDLSFSTKSFYEWTQTSSIFEEISLVEPTILIINALLISYLGVRITQKLVKHPSWSTLAVDQKRSVLVRLLGTVGICCTSFLLRASFLIVLWIDGATQISYDIWWIFSTWVPTIIPAFVLMYTMRRTESRKRDNESSSWRWKSMSESRSPTKPSSPFREKRINSNDDVNYESDQDRLYFSGFEDDSDDEGDRDNLSTSPSSSGVEPLLNKLSSKQEIDFFQGAPDMRPAFYRTQSFPTSGSIDVEELQ